MSGPVPRVFVSGPRGEDGSYFSLEQFFNELSVKLLNSNTVKALSVAIVDSNGNQVVPDSPGTAIVSGTKTVTTAGTAVQVTATPTTIKSIYVSADMGNVKSIVVGDSSVVAALSSQRGIQLIPGATPIKLDINDLSLLWVDALSSGDKLSYAYIS